MVESIDFALAFVEGYDYKTFVADGFCAANVPTVVRIFCG